MRATCLAYLTHTEKKRYNYGFLLFLSILNFLRFFRSSSFPPFYLCVGLEYILIKYYVDELLGVSDEPSSYM
jgi:hypothetical protein